MHLGMIKVAAAVPEVKVADVSFNMRQTLQLMQQAAAQKAEIIVFPELGLTGYTCADLFRQSLLLDQAEENLQMLLRQSAKLNLLCVLGMPLRVGNALYNCAVVFQKGEILGVVPKTFLPNYGEFYEKRWFHSASDAAETEICLSGRRVPFGSDLLFCCGSVIFGVEICEDLWVPVPPSSLAALAGANLILNLSASNEAAGKHTYLKSLVLQQSARCCSGYVYASAGYGESSTDLVFAGNAFIAENGTLLQEGRRFQTCPQLAISEIDIEKLQAERRFRASFADARTATAWRKIAFSLTQSPRFSLTRPVAAYPFVPAEGKRKERCEEILSIQAFGLAQRLRRSGARTALIGVSGGLDSTLALLATARAFDLLGRSRKDIVGVTMPCFGTTDRTYQNALALMKALGVSSREVDIKKAVLQHLQDLHHPTHLHNVTYENAQARERTQVLMDMANQLNGLVIGTGDLSELALGWATYNGDHMSMYGINCSVPKTLVRYLVEYAAQETTNKKLTAVLKDILATPVSPELLPPQGKDIAQRTEDLVGPYALHDFFLYYFLRFGFSPAKIYRLARQAFEDQYKPAEIKKWLQVFLKRFFAQQFKRSCLPDGPKIGSVSLSPRGDWRMPSDAEAAPWSEECKNL